MTYEENEGIVVVLLKGHSLKFGLHINFHIVPQGTVFIDFVTVNVPIARSRSQVLSF